MNKTIYNILFVLFSVVIGKIIGSLTTPLVAKYLLPAKYGMWVTLMLISTFSPIICFGTVETLLKEVPYYKGTNNRVKVKEIEDGVFSSIIVAAFLLLIIGLNFNIFVPDLMQVGELWQLRVMFIAAMFSLFSGYFYYRFVSYQNFRMVSMLDSVKALSSCILLITGAKYWGLPGAITGYLLNELFICAVSAALNIRVCGKIGFNFDWKLQRDLIRIGFPITIIWWVFMVQAGAGRIISMSMLGKTATGFLGLGGSIVSLITLIPQAVGAVLYPKVGEKLGKGATKDDLNMRVMVPARLFAIGIPLFIGALLILSPLIYTKIFPEYAHGLSAAQIMLLGVYFVCILRFGVNYIIGIHKQQTLLKYFLISLVVNVVASIALVKLDLNINGIAAGQLISAFILSTLIWRSVFEYMGHQKSSQFYNIYLLYLPFLLLSGVFCITKVMAPNILINYTPLSFYVLIVFCIFYAVMMCLIPSTRKWIEEFYTIVKKKTKQPDRQQEIRIPAE